MRRDIVLLCLAALLVCGGCIRGDIDQNVVAADPTRAQDTWDRFETASQRAAALSGPFRISAALYYAGKEGSQRVTVYFWGNNAAETADGLTKASLWPLRLDILMGPGSVMGKALETGGDFTIYVPREETAYHHTGDGPALLAFGVPVPFSLADLSLILTGQYQRAFVNADSAEGSALPSAYAGTDGSIVYALNGRLPGILEVTPDGLPRVWQEKGGKGWKLSFEYWDESTRTTPRRLHVVHPQGAEATLVVRELARPDSFTPAQMELTLPGNTRFAPLRMQN